MIARLTLATLLLAVPAAQAADLAIRAVVVKSARVSVQAPQRVAVTTSSKESVQVTLLPASDREVRVVFTP